MASTKETVIIVGSGNIAQYLSEEFLADGTYDVGIISRTPRDFFTKPGISFHQLTTYTVAALTSILDSTGAKVLISTLQGADPAWYTSTHETILAACRASQTCKRLISSEYMGNLRSFNQLPRGNYYARQPFRDILANQTDVKYTLVCQGWLADYWVQPPDGSRSYMRPFPEGWPVDITRNTARIAGTGDEMIGWTAARDMAKAVVKLIPHADWPDHTYVYGEIGTWNQAIDKYERFFGVEVKRTYRTKEDVYDALLQTEDRARWYTATMDEWSMLGGTALPKDEADHAREKYFKDVHFRTLDELFSDSTKVQIL